MTAPCSSGFADIGVLLDGKRLGSKECSAVPRVCGVPLVVFEGGWRSWEVVGFGEVEDRGRYGGIAACRMWIWPCEVLVAASAISPSASFSTGAEGR